MKNYNGETWIEFFKKFLSFYFVLRIPIALAYLYVYPKTLIEIFYHHIVKRHREKKKWFLLT